MGECAEYKGQRIKIGTCEDLYYLRADQRDAVTALPRNVHPGHSAYQDRIRFRFPWPDEDATEPGAFEDPDRHLAVWGVRVPDGVEHDRVQFTSRVGYVISLPCPEGPRATVTDSTGQSLRAARNGFRGPVLIVQQAYRGPERELVTVCQCGGCGAKYWLDRDDARDVVQALRAQGQVWYRQIADRIAAGYRGGLVEEEVAHGSER